MDQFYLGEILLPVAPEKVTARTAGKNKTVTLINEGEINLLKTPGLTEYKFKALFPNTQYPFASYPDGYRPGSYYLDALERLAAGAKPFWFRILRSRGGAFSHQTKCRASLEEYSVEESAENGGDLLVDVTLKLYRDWGTKVLVLGDGTAGEEAQRDPEPIKPKGKEYTIQDGDTLWGIAQRFLGDGSRYHEVYTRNKEALDGEAARRGMGSGQGERWIFTGTRLTLPEK